MCVCVCVCVCMWVVNDVCGGGVVNDVWVWVGHE